MSNHILDIKAHRLEVGRHQIGDYVVTAKTLITAADPPFVKYKLRREGRQRWNGMGTEWEPTHVIDDWTLADRVLTVTLTCPDTVAADLREFLRRRVQVHGPKLPGHDRVGAWIASWHRERPWWDFIESISAHIDDDRTPHVVVTFPDTTEATP